MKKILLSLIMIASVNFSLIAQDATSGIRELGLNLGGINSFGVRYRSGNENILFRLTLLSLNGYNQNYKANPNQSSSNGSIGFGINAGFEKRKSITENLNFYCGSDLLIGLDRSMYKNPPFSHTQKEWALSPGIGLVLGFVYKISSDLNISAEVVPSVSYSYSKTTVDLNGIKTEQINKSFIYGFSNSVGNITLSFRLGKKK